MRVIVPLGIGEGGGSSELSTAGETEATFEWVERILAAGVSGAPGTGPSRPPERAWAQSATLWSEKLCLAMPPGGRCRTLRGKRLRRGQAANQCQ